MDLPRRASVGLRGSYRTHSASLEGSRTMIGCARHRADACGYRNSVSSSILRKIRFIDAPARARASADRLPGPLQRDTVSRDRPMRKSRPALGDSGAPRASGLHTRPGEERAEPHHRAHLSVIPQPWQVPRRRISRRLFPSQIAAARCHARDADEGSRTWSLALDTPCGPLARARSQQLQQYAALPHAVPSD